MTRVRHIFVTSANSPYQRMLKVTDDVPAVATDFPVQNSPIPLVAGGMSPDGKYALGAGSASSTVPFRLWKMDDAFSWTTVPNANLTLSLAGTIVDLLWLTDTHFIAVDSTNGAWIGVLNRANDTVAFTRFDTLAGLLSVTPLDSTGEAFFLARSAGAPYTRYWKRVGDTVQTLSITGTGPNFAIVNGFADLATNNYVTARSGQTTAVYGFFGFDFSTTPPTMLFSSSYQQMEAPSNGVLAAMPAAAFSPTGKHFVYSTDNAADFYLRMETLVNKVRPNRWYRSDPVVLTTPMPAPATEIKFVNDTLLLVGVNSTAAGSGRVRAFVHDAGKETLTEIDAYSDLFDDWSMIPTTISFGAEATRNTKVSLYDSTPESILARTVDLTNLKIALVSSAAVFDPTDLTLAEALGANEVVASSWPAGGIDCNDATFADVGSTGSAFAFTMTVPTLDLAAAGTVTFRAAIIYDNTAAGKKPLAFIDYGADQSAEQFKRMHFAFPADRVFVTQTAN